MTEPVRSDWDGLMLTMDVADSLRRLRAEREPDSREGSDSESEIRELQETYQAQGIELSEGIVRQAAAALEDDRFSYAPPPDGWKRSLAHLWIVRGKWGWVAGPAVLALIIVSAWLAIW